MPTETTLNSLKVHKVPNFETWEENYDQVNGIGTSDVVVMPPEELKKGVLPPQANNSGKFLTTNGAAASWSTVSIPSAADATPIMDGTAAVGTSTDYAREDHVHPTDTSRAASSHTHGNITNTGALQTTDVTIANGDKLVVTDSSNSSKIARTSIAFDGSTTTKYLSQKGTWETEYTHPTTTATAAAAVKVGNDTNGHVVLGSALTASDVGAAASSHAHGNITSGGDITATAPTIASGDQIVINDHSASKITNGPTFDGSTTTKYLSQKGTWESIPDVSAAIAGLGSILNYKGTKTTESNLPTTGNTAGDVWIVTTDNSEYVWDGENWEKLGPTIDLSGYVPTSRKVNGKALSSDITLSASDVSAATSSHTHGNITNAGALQTTDITIANGDKIIVTDSSDSNKVARTSIAFDGSTTTKFLAQKGTWETPTDNKVSQSASTSSTWHKLLLHYTEDSTSTTAVTSVTNQTYSAVGVSAQPSTGTLRATVYNVEDKVKLQYNSTTQALDFIFI